MIDIEFAKNAFEKYLSNYNEENPKIKLKKIHTYEVIKAAEYICKYEGFSKEDRDLAYLIALLHDIGRFEQLKKFNSFDDRKFDHAKFGVYVLFSEGLIKNFIKEDRYNDIIKNSILYHSVFKVPNIENDRIKLHINIVRDADKLDNFRVKNIEKIETLLDITEEELGKQQISNKICEDIKNCKLICHSDRKTAMDMWVSYLAFIFDLNFKASYAYIEENDYINKNIDRISYKNEETLRKMEEIREIMLGRINEELKSCPK